MKTAYRRIICIFAAAVIGLSSGCSVLQPSSKTSAHISPTLSPSKQASSDGIFSINYSKQYGLNPLNGSNRVNQLASGLVYESLFTLDNNFNYYPVLCDSWTTVEGVSFKFVIKNGISFQDGSQLTAYDVAYSLNQAKKSGIYGERLSKVSEIKVETSYVLSITLTKADMMFPALLDIPVIREGSINSKTPLGTGPYFLSSDSRGICLEAYQGYRNYKNLPVQKIYLQEFNTENILNAFENNYLDLVFVDPLDISSVNIKGSNDSRYFDTTSLQYLGFNMNTFSSSEVRRALGFAVDRDSITGGIMAYSASPAYVPTLMMKDDLASIKSGLYYSPDKVKEILGESGISDKNKDGLLEYKDGVRFTVRFLANKDNPFKLAAAKSIADTLTKLGVTVDFRQLSWEDYKKALDNGDFDMYYAEATLTADFDLSAILKSGGALNFGRVKDGAYSVLIDAYLAADDNTRKAAAEALYGDIAKTAPIIPVVFRRQAVVSKRGVVDGAEPSKSSVFRGIENWGINLG